MFNTGTSLECRESRLSMKRIYPCILMPVSTTSNVHYQLYLLSSSMFMPFTVVTKSTTLRCCR